MSDNFINAGSRLQCSQCSRLQLFQRNIPEEALPFIIRCSFKDCNYSFSFNKGDIKPIFSKVDPVNRVQGNWVVEMQSEKTPDYWKPSGTASSFREKCNAIATFLASGLQTIEALKQDLKQLTNCMTEQFSAEWGTHAAFLKSWHPGRVDNWIKQPFLAFPIPCHDKVIASRSRLFIHPNFFAPQVGFVLPGYGGFNAQLITPYLLINFPLESWLRNLMEIKPTPDLRVVGDRIVGRELFFCWNDIPGTVPDAEHREDAPLLRIKDQLVARTWLAKQTVSPWGVGTLTEDHAFKALWTHFEGDTARAWQYRAFRDFQEHGRIALFCEKYADAWEIALTIAAYIFGEKLVLLSSLERKANYTGLLREATNVKANTSVHWKQVTQPSDLADIEWEQLGLLIIDYDANFPVECLQQLYGYPGRLIIINRDYPIMDFTEENWEASLFFGLVAKTIWHPTLPAVHYEYDYDQDSSQDYTAEKNSQENLVRTLLAQWRKTETRLEG
jgi:hypothetical protein